MSKIKAHMTTNIISAKPSDTVYDIAKIMGKKSISVMLILNKGKLVGIITERDFVSKIICKGLDPKKTLAKDVMSKKIIAASPEMHVVKVATLMSEHKIKKVPVVDHGKLVGLITQTDLMKILCYR